MILQENLSRNAFPRFFVPVRRINVHSSLMPLKFAPGEHISECAAAKMELKCRHENDSSGFVHRPAMQFVTQQVSFENLLGTVNHNLTKRLTVMCTNHY